MKVKTLKYITCSIARSSVQTENSPYPKGGYVQFRGWIRPIQRVDSSHSKVDSPHLEGGFAPFRGWIRPIQREDSSHSEGGIRPI